MVRGFGEVWAPLPFQEKAVQYLLEHPCAGLLLDPGWGKTSCTLEAFRALKEKGVAKRMLVVAPLRACWLVWPLEVQKWARFAGLSYKVLHGKDKERRMYETTDITCVNLEGLDWLLGKKETVSSFGIRKVGADTRRLQSFGFDTLVFDELSKFKHVNTQRFKLIKHVLRLFRRRWGLTGSPASNGLMDLFGQAFVLDEGRTFGPYITHYRAKYFTPSYNGFDWNLRPGAEAEIYERARPLFLRPEAGDYLKLPELFLHDIRVELPPVARKVYSDMEDELLASVKDNEVTAANMGAASNKCRQIANGAVYDADSQVLPVHDAKLDALEELLEELQGQPLLVAYEFRHDLERLLKRFKNPPFLGGGVSTQKADQIVEAWNRGEIPLLLAQPMSVGHGLNLQGSCRNVCWFGLTWDYEIYDQFNRRVLRQGNAASHVFIHRILAKGTLDERVAELLAKKQNVQKALFEGLQNDS